MDRKSFKDISWDVDEPTYRADPALSYSTLAKYEREGFNGIDHLFDKLETSSLTFGSAVDSIITGGKEEFDSRFLVAEFPPVPDSIIKVVKLLFNEFGVTHRTLASIPDVEVIGFAGQCNYQSNWKPETRAKVIKEKGAEYYNLLFVAGDKTILDGETNKDVENSVNALKNSDATRFYFAPNNPFTPDIERFYQLKFKATFNNVNYRSMADLIIVDYKNKVVIPCDLKTSSHMEWDFYKSFVDWKYDIQARLYWANIRQNMDKDPYFKDFELLDYRFIVVNRKTLCPLVWVYPYTKELTEDLTFGKDGNILFRSPLKIGEELSYYLSSRPVLPIGIKRDDSNDIVEWLNKE